MYDKLIQRLRDIAQSDRNLKSNYIGLSLLQAADAIEELSRENESLGKTLCESTELVRKLRKPKWIPVTERLPDIETRAIVYTRTGELCVGTYTEYGWMVPFCIGRITHWMPLPEPPKGEEE